MKIVVINSVYQPDTRGGAEVVVESIVSGLKGRGHDVVVVCVGRQNKVDVISNLICELQDSHGHSFRSLLRDDNSVKVYHIKPFNLFNFLDIDRKPAWLRLPWHIIDMFSDIQIWRVYKVIGHEKPDLVLTHNLKGLGYYIPWMLRLMKIRNIHTVHDMQLLHPSGLIGEDLKLGIFAKLYSLACRKLFDSPDTVVFPSEYIKGVYDQFGFFKNSERVVIPNPIVIPRELKRLLGSQGLQDGIATLPLVARNDNFFQILFLGQVEEYKGILDLIEVVKNLQGDLVLNIVGDGKSLDKAKQLAGDDNRFVFHGWLTQEQLALDVWPNTDLLVNPSQVSESFGMVVIEAYSHGVPVLVSDKGALPELVREGETGFVFDDLEQKLKWCTNNQDKLAQMEENCLKEAENYSIDRYLNKLSEFVNID